MDADVKEHPTAVMGFARKGGEGYFEAVPSAASEARRWVGAYLQSVYRVHTRASADAVDDSRLAVTELVTNARREPTLFTLNGEPAVCVRVVECETVYRVEVYDGNPTPPPEVPECASETSTAGRGLFLVDAFVAERGCDPYTHPKTGRRGKCVWFTVPRGE